MSGINPTATAVAVGDTATIVVADATTPTGRNEDGRCTYEIYNLGPDAIFIGDGSVTAATGAPLPAHAARTIAVRLAGKIWAVCAEGETADVRVLRVP